MLGNTQFPARFPFLQENLLFLLYGPALRQYSDFAVFADCCEADALQNMKAERQNFNKRRGMESGAVLPKDLS